MKMSSKSKRYYILDYIRAFVILNMVLYHILWDMVYVFDADISCFDGVAGHIWERFICMSFIILSGFCWSLSSNHIKRGIIIFLCGFIISVVTVLFTPDVVIIFGILTFLGSTVLIMIFLDKLLKYIPSAIGMIISFLLFVSIYRINTGKVLFGFIKIPLYLYSGELMTYLGFMEKGFYSADYFSLLPWLFLFVFGYFLYGFMRERNILYILQGRQIKTIEFISRNSLLIYVLHQPVIYGVLLLM